MFCTFFIYWPGLVCYWTVFVASSKGFSGIFLLFKKQDAQFGPLLRDVAQIPAPFDQFGTERRVSDHPQPPLSLRTPGWPIWKSAPHVCRNHFFTPRLTFSGTTRAWSRSRWGPPFSCLCPSKKFLKPPKSLDLAVKSSQARSGGCQTCSKGAQKGRRKSIILMKKTRNFKKDSRKSERKIRRISWSSSVAKLFLLLFFVFFWLFIYFHFILFYFRLFQVGHILGVPQ